jgi:hypothetical protein
MYGVIDFSRIDTMPGGFGPFAPPAGWQGDYRQFLQTLRWRHRCATADRSWSAESRSQDRRHAPSSWPACRRSEEFALSVWSSIKRQLTQQTGTRLRPEFSSHGECIAPRRGRCLPVFHWRHHVRQIRTPSRTGSHRAWDRQCGLWPVSSLQHRQPDSGGHPACKAPAPVAHRELQRWKDLGRSVCKGQKALSLWMPITVKRRARTPTGDSGDRRRSDEVLRCFKLAPRWFSLEQTEGEDYVEPIESPQWDAEAAMTALGHHAGALRDSWTGMCRAMR